MDLSNLTPKAGSRHRKKRLGIGYGSGHGKTATRGMKGQRARSGDGKQIGFEGGQMPLLRRIPKRGFTNAAFRTEYAVVNLGRIAKAFKSAEVSPEALREKGLVRSSRPVKILGDGELKAALTVKAHAFSASAKEKIEKAGGQAQVVGAMEAKQAKEATEGTAKRQ